MAAEFLPGNRLTLLNSGADYFPALLAALTLAALAAFAARAALGGRSLIEAPALGD